MMSLIEEEIIELAKLVNQKYINTLFKDKNDKSACFLTVHCGSGGLESEDWARMLWEMYLKYTNDNFNIEILDFSNADEGGIKNATMKISKGKKEFPYGFLKGESGVHRLVRISPYDKKKQRHTSFASVAVLAEIDETIDVSIDPSEIRIDTYRASGAGGQHVNKTDSAIRITHLSTGIVVQCQNDRSQHKNKDEAMKMLKSKLYERRIEELRKEKASMGPEKKEITWGSQIRSYVQQPYQMVKDNRTDFEVPNFKKVVFDGEIEGFLIEYLKKTLD
jgi:peptide chain release factor 2